MQDFSDKIDTFIDENQMYTFEGERGVRNLEKLTKALGYNEPFGSSLTQFLADNSGAIEAIIEWIKECRNEEWDENITAQIPDEEEDEDNEDE